jgi:hypothetical protein
MAEYLHHWCSPCPFTNHGSVWRVGVHVFHGHVAALSIASGMNERAGQKVVKIIMDRGHFRITKI